MFALPETNITPENGPSHMEINLPTKEGNDPRNTCWLVVEPTLIEKYARQIGSSP